MKDVQFEEINFSYSFIFMHFYYYNWKNSYQGNNMKKQNKFNVNSFWFHCKHD